MPYVRGKLKGELKTSEIRKLVRAHNKLSQIKIPPRSTREDILSIIDKAGFKINHEKQLLEQMKPVRKIVTLEGAQEITKPKPRVKKAQRKPAEPLAIEDKSQIESTKPTKKTGRGFKVERRERKKMLDALNFDSSGRPIKPKFDPFKILGIKAREETPELVKSRCRELRLTEHPDKGGDAEKFDLIQKACKILLDTQTILK